MLFWFGKGPLDHEIGDVCGRWRIFADETSQPARVMTGTLVSGDTTFVVVDFVVDNSPSPSMYTLSVNTTNL